MATTYPVLLRGGPCNDRTVTVSADQLASGMASCGGQVYRYAPDTHDPYIFQLASDQELGKPVGAPPDARAVFPAFRALMHTLAFTVPTELHRARGSINRLRRAVK